MISFYVGKRGCGSSYLRHAKKRKDSKFQVGCNQASKVQKIFFSLKCTKKQQTTVIWGDSGTPGCLRQVFKKRLYKSQLAILFLQFLGYLLFDH